MLSFEAARAKVIEVVGAHVAASAAASATAAGACTATIAPSVELIDISQGAARALGRVLAGDVVADRDYPPFDRSTRDGYAVRAADAAAAGARLRLIGESRAGVAFDGTVSEGECVRILTGAAVPRGADGVIMQEYAETGGGFVVFGRAAERGQNVVPEGSEAQRGDVAVARGTRLGFAELAMAAQVGQTRLRVNRRPTVAILSTGDEVVSADEQAGPFQIRNSNGISLAAQVASAGGEPVSLGNARDEIAELRQKIARGLESDILILSGGVSVGTYDLVEEALRELGAEFFFDSVAIRPGKPAVFGRCHGKPVFGLPGNPVSTMVTFELFVVPAIEILSGAEPRALPLFGARLAHAVNEKPPLAHFLPALVRWPGSEPEVELIPWQGSGDVRAVVKANCFLVVRGEKQRFEAGEWGEVMPRRGML